MKKKEYLNYPLAFKEVKIGAPREYIKKESDNNKFYEDTRFSPTSFYKPIIKL